MRAEAAEAEKLVEATELRGAARRRVRGCRRSVLEADLMLRLTADMFFDDDGQATVDPALSCLFLSLLVFSPESQWPDGGGRRRVRGLGGRERDWTGEEQEEGFKRVESRGGGTGMDYIRQWL
jgi:hypothetical protein